jgi:hypothetical protein
MTQLVEDNPIVALILACEVGLWVLPRRRRPRGSTPATGVVATREQSGTLTWWIGRLWVVVGIWLVAGPLWESGGSRATAGRR